MDKEELNKERISDEEIMNSINVSLAKQVSEQYSQNIDNQTFDSFYESNKTSSKKYKKVPLWLKVSVSVFSVILLIGIGGLLYLNSLYNSMNYDNGAPVQQGAEYFEQDEEAANLEEVDPNSVHWGEEDDRARKDSNVINILLIGEEKINDGPGRGRTDSIMIATVNIKEKALRLTSIMRDMYVQIPGFSDNKINAAYHNGGMPLLIDTIKRNFDLEVDGYVLVDFNAFEQIIDRLGGVEVTLSQTEANYLNRTNYISNPAYRNVRAGKHTLNGNQALGYSRIRYVPNGDQSDDFGRTSRQREVLNAIFDKYKSKNVIELLALLPDMLSMVTTNIEKGEFTEYITTVMTLGTTELETLRLPIDNGFKNTRIRGMSVLLPNDLQINIDALHKFIFGEVLDETVTTSNTTLLN